MDRRWKTLGILAATAAALAALTGCGPDGREAVETVSLTADYPAYESVDAMWRTAPLVVEVELGDPRYDVLLPDYSSEDPERNPYAGTEITADPGRGVVPITVYSGIVQTVFKGEVTDGDVIEVKQAGGVMEGVRYEVEGVGSIGGDSSLLLFLETYPDAPASVLGGDIGAFRAVGEDFVSLGDAKLVVSAKELASLR